MTETKEEVKEEVKEETKEETKEVVKEVVIPAKNLSPFVRNNTSFVCKIGYYLKPDGSGFMVEGDEDYKKEEKTNEFKVTFRLPNQKDANIIAEGSQGTATNEMGIFKAFNDLEYIRFLVLLVDWTLEKPCTEESIESLHPSFVKGMVTALREKIGMDGIV